MIIVKNLELQIYKIMKFLHKKIKVNLMIFLTKFKILTTH